MAIKSELYAVNSNTQMLATGGIVNFGNTVRKYGCGIFLSGGNVNINGKGYYDIDANLTLVPQGAGTLIVTVYKDGVAIPGAEVTITAVADSIYSISIPTVARQTCCCDGVITVVTSGVETEVENAAIRVVAL